MKKRMAEKTAAASTISIAAAPRSFVLRDMLRIPFKSSPPLNRRR